MLKNKLTKAWLAVAVVGALFGALSVQAQTTATQPAPAGGSTQATPPATSPSTTGDNKAQLSKADQRILVNMALANMSEIEASRLAQTKGQSEQVKNFAQQMIDDHTKALTEVQQLAQTKGVTLPTQLDRQHKAKADKLGALSGDAFDKAYLAQTGVADHKKTHGMLRQAQNRAKDPDIKALAARLMPTVDQHLNSAQQMHDNKGTARGSTGTGTEKSGQ